MTPMEEITLKQSISNWRCLYNWKWVFISIIVQNILGLVCIWYFNDLNTIRIIQSLVWFTICGAILSPLFESIIGGRK